MIAYRYDTEQKNKYAGEQPCQRDPIASLKAGKEVFLLPGDCTYTPPLPKKEGFDIVFNIEKSEWEYTEAKKDEVPEPAESPELTAEDKVNQLTSDYESARSQLFQYYMDAIIEGDVDTQADLQTELAELKESYEADVTSVMNNEEV